MNLGASDIVEKDTSDQAPAPPSIKPKKAFTKKWAPKRRPVVLDPTAPIAPTTADLAANNTASAGDTAPNSTEQPLSEAERIHLENIRKMQRMTPEEIERERAEIMRSMDPSVLESLLKRAEKKEAEVANRKPSLAKPALQEPTAPVVGTQAPAKGMMAEWDPSPDALKPNYLPPPSGPPDLTEIDAENSHVHFVAPGPNELRQYFPDLPVETDKLAWMQPIDDAEEAEYSTELVSIAPSELRFDFHGDLITPRRSREIPVSAGLHHHGDAPSAAGYTLPELAHLCRSTHPAQRAMAIQTVGRVLHKLRLRKFARSSELQEGLNALVQQTRVMDSLAEAASDSTRSLTVRTRAIEALWLANTDNKSENLATVPDNEENV